MKALLLPLAAVAALSGCATYVDPGYGYYGQPSASIHYQTGPSYGAPGYYGAPQRQYRDRDRDGIPNRMDADRDNDGVPNQYDSRPNNPYRR